MSVGIPDLAKDYIWRHYFYQFVELQLFIFLYVLCSMNDCKYVSEFILNLVYTKMFTCNTDVNTEVRFVYS